MGLSRAQLNHQLDNLIATTDPLVTDDSSAGYGVSSKWINLTTDIAFELFDATVGAALWKQSSDSILTDAQVKIANENNPNTNEFNDAEKAKLALLVAGYLGFFTTESALNTAHPTGNSGEHATVGSTDTVWAWDADTVAWIDTHTTDFGDMLKAVYDPTSVLGDAFDMDNMNNGATNKFNETHTGDIAGSTALTAQPSMISGKPLILADAADFLLAINTDSGDALSKVSLGDLIGGGVGVADSVRVTAKVNEAGGISAGQVLYLSGATGGFPQVSLADNATFSEADTLAVANETQANNQTIIVTILGLLENIDTSSFSEGAILYLGTSGALTSTHPSGTDAIQRIGHAVKINASTGSILVELDSLTVIDDLDGVIRHQLVNQNAGTTATAAYTMVNDANHRGSVSFNSSNHSIGENMNWFNSGYGLSIFINDGNKGYQWYTDVTDAHALAGTLKMELKPNGDLELVGTVDGRDVAADGAILDAIEPGADVTDATNVDAAGATMNLDTNLAANSWFKDDDTLAGDDNTKVVSEQAIKAYVDAEVAGAGGGADGWHGSVTKIKILPTDFLPVVGGTGNVAIVSTGAYLEEQDKVNTYAVIVNIPTGFKATAFNIYCAANNAMEIFENRIDDGTTTTSKGSGNCNTEVNMTDVDSTTTNYLTIIITEGGDNFYGGDVTIAPI